MTPNTFTISEANKRTVTVEPRHSVKDPAALCALGLDVFGRSTISVFLGVADGKTVLTIVGYEQPDHAQKLSRLYAAVM